MKSTGRHGVYKFQSIAQPDCYLGYVDGFIVGYVSTLCCYGDECVYSICCYGDEHIYSMSKYIVYVPMQKSVF